jgi:hypothetical protein
MSVSTIEEHPKIIVGYIPDPSGTQFGTTYKWNSAEFATLESAQSMQPVFNARLVNITAGWGSAGSVATPQWALLIPGDVDPHNCADIGTFVKLFGDLAIYNEALRKAYGIPTPVK